MPKPKLNSRIAKEYKKKFKMDIRLALIVSPSLVYIIFGILKPDVILSSNILFPLFLAAILLVLVSLKIAYDNWRCPKCNEYMGIVWHPKYCAKCGERLR